MSCLTVKELSRKTYVVSDVHGTSVDGFYTAQSTALTLRKASTDGSTEAKCSTFTAMKLDDV
jgi:hypothetical protein